MAREWLPAFCCWSQQTRQQLAWPSGYGIRVLITLVAWMGHTVMKLGCREQITYIPFPPPPAPRCRSLTLSPVSLFRTGPFHPWDWPWSMAMSIPTLSPWGEVPRGEALWEGVHFVYGNSHLAPLRVWFCMKSFERSDLWRSCFLTDCNYSSQAVPFYIFFFLILRVLMPALTQRVQTGRVPPAAWVISYNFYNSIQKKLQDPRGPLCFWIPTHSETQL